MKIEKIRNDYMTIKRSKFKDDKIKMDNVKQYLISIVGKQYPQL